MTTTQRPNRGSFAAMYEASRQVSHDASPRSLRLDQLEPNPGQPRTQFHSETLEELATSIKTYGVLQPLMVRPHPSGERARYQIVAGERRYQACKLAGIEAVPVVIKSMNDAEVREVALIENLQRENITPLEEAAVLKQILDETGLKHRELGDRIGKTKAYVEQRVRLLRYPDEVREALAAPVDSAVFSPGHAKAVVQLDDASERRALIGLIEATGLSVREAERRVHQLKRVHEHLGEDERAQKLVGEILRPDGMADTRLEAALVSPGAKPAKGKTAGTVDLRELAVAAMLLEAQTSGQWLVDAAAIERALKADLASLR